MTLIKLGSILKQRREKYDGIDDLPIRGVSKNGLISPKQDDADTSIYNVFYKNDFVFNPARMELNSIEINIDFEKAICSSLYEVFYIKDTSKILPLYLYLFLKRNEFARKCWFKAIGSARDYFRFKNLCDLEMEIPPIEIQRKYVSIYEGLLANLKSYEDELEDLKLVCDGYIEDLKKRYKSEKLKDYIIQYKDINKFLKVTKLAGLFDGKIVNPRSTSSQDDLSRYQIVYPTSVVYPPPHFGEIGTIGIVENEPVLLSPMYVAFKSKNEELLNLHYALLWFRRKSFMKYAFFVSCDSVRDTFDFNKMCEYEIPIPPLEVQNSIVAIFNAYNKRKEFIDKLKNTIKIICPILIKGSLDEARSVSNG